MDPIEKVKYEIEQLIGIYDSDTEVFWSLSKKCATYALAPSAAAGIKWGPGLVSLGTVALPGIGTVSGTTATLLLMSGVWGGSYMSCMTLLPGLMKIRDTLRTDYKILNMTRNEARFLITANRPSYST